MNLVPAQAEVLSQATEMIDGCKVQMGFEHEFRMQPKAGAYKSREPVIFDYCDVLDISRSILGDAAEPEPVGKGILVDPDDYADLQLLPDNHYTFAGLDPESCSYVEICSVPTKPSNFIGRYIAVTNALSEAALSLGWDMVPASTHVSTSYSVDGKRVSFWNESDAISEHATDFANNYFGLARAMWPWMLQPDFLPIIGQVPLQLRPAKDGSLVAHRQRIEQRLAHPECEPSVIAFIAAAAGKLTAENAGCFVERVTKVRHGFLTVDDEHFTADQIIAFEFGSAPADTDMPSNLSFGHAVLSDSTFNLAADARLVLDSKLPPECLITPRMASRARMNLISSTTNFGDSMYGGVFSEGVPVVCNEYGLASEPIGLPRDTNGNRKLASETLKLDWAHDLFDPAALRTLSTSKF